MSDIEAVLSSYGWVRAAHFAGTLYLDADCSEAQTSAWTDSPSLVRRFHVRFWQTGQDVLAAAHYETLRAFKGHEVHHFEGAEEMISDIFQSHGWTVNRRAIRMNNRELVRYNDGLLTEIIK